MEASVGASQQHKEMLAMSQIYYTGTSVFLKKKNLNECHPHVKNVMKNEFDNKSPDKT